MTLIFLAFSPPSLRGLSIKTPLVIVFMYFVISKYLYCIYTNFYILPKTLTMYVLHTTYEFIPATLLPHRPPIVVFFFCFFCCYSSYITIHTWRYETWLKYFIQTRGGPGRKGGMGGGRIQFRQPRTRRYHRWARLPRAR